MAKKVCEHYNKGECECPAPTLCMHKEFDDYDSWCGLSEQFNELLEVSGDSSHD
jgi:hypothetical protein